MQNERFQLQNVAHAIQYGRFPNAANSMENEHSQESKKNITKKENLNSFLYPYIDEYIDNVE
jgi:hypothetical protein